MFAATATNRSLSTGYIGYPFGPAGWLATHHNRRLTATPDGTDGKKSCRQPCRQGLTASDKTT